MNKKSIPNLLTFLRVLAVPVALVLVVFFPLHKILLLWLFVAAAITDFFDGYLARKWKAESPIGALLDPMADKLLVAVVLLHLVEHTFAPMLAAAIIILREIYIAGLREFLAQQRIPLPVSKGGKWKTALQMLAITLLLVALAYRIHPHVWNAGIALLWISAVFALTSAVGYTRRAWPHVKDGRSAAPTSALGRLFGAITGR